MHPEVSSNVSSQFFITTDLARYVGIKKHLFTDTCHVLEIGQIFLSIYYKSGKLHVMHYVDEY